mgnify:CR=1 FL=1
MNSRIELSWDSALVVIKELVKAGYHVMCWTDEESDVCVIEYIQPEYDCMEWVATRV